MSTSSHKIASQTNNCSFRIQSVEKFLALMATQQADYSDISYKANGSFTLVLRAKKNGIAEEVALKVLECTDRTDSQIQAMEGEYAITKQLPSSDYFLAIQNQFYLTEIDFSAEQGQSDNTNTTARKVYFVQEMEMCQESLHDMIQHYSENKKDPPSESFKELLAIQMLDAVNLLHQKHIAHGNIITQHFLVLQNFDYPILLKLRNLRLTSLVNPRNTENSVSENESLNSMPPMGEIQTDCIEQDLASLGKIFLQLAKCDPHFDYSTISNITLDQPELTTMLETHQLNQSTLLYQIACSLLSNSKKNCQAARSMLLLLLEKQTGTLNIPLFSVVLKSHLDSLRLPIPSKGIKLDFLVWQMSRQNRFHNIGSQFNDKGQRKTELTVDLIKSALSIMLEWKEFRQIYDVIGVGVGGVVFGVENLVEKRKSALKLSLCTNKAEAIREIGIRRICQASHIVKFFGSRFFKDANGNEFVVQELERCKYSLIQHLELQRIYGEQSDEQKNLMVLQMIDSVTFLHENRILHRNIKLDSFFITENQTGQTIVKLGNFSHAVQLQDKFEELSTLDNQILKLEYDSPVNCILQKHNRESPMYFAPERQRNPELSTYLTDSFSVGLCIFLLDNYFACSEEQLARKMLSVPLKSAEICLDMNHFINTKFGYQRIAKQLLKLQPQQRTSLRNLAEKQNRGSSQDLEENNYQKQIMLKIENSKEIEDFKQAPMRFNSIYSSCVNLNTIKVKDTEVESLLNLISNLHNLSRISLHISKSSILYFRANNILSPLTRLANLSSISLHLQENSIGDIGAQSLLSPLANLLNLSSVTLRLNNNQIGDLGAQCLLSPLANLLNLSSLTLHLDNNQIGDIGAQSLLSPLANHFNLARLDLNLNFNSIGDKGSQHLLTPLVNLLNLSSLVLNLNYNQIGDVGSQSLLSPLVNLFNLSSLTLNLNSNRIGDIGAQSLLSPLAALLNISSLTLNLFNNQIGDIGAKSLLFLLANLLNLSTLTLNLINNQIKQIEEQFMLSLFTKFLNLSSLTLKLFKSQIGIRAQVMLSSLVNLLNLSSLTLHLEKYSIGRMSARSLLSPLANLLNLSSLALNLNHNKIEDMGAQSLLSPLANLHNLSFLTLLLEKNQIGSMGAQSLLSPLANLLNLSSLSLNLNSNSIGNIGAQSLLSPLANLLNMSSLSLDLECNSIGDTGAQSLLSHLANLLNLSSLSLNLNFNQIGVIGAQSLLSPLKNLPESSSLTLNLFNNQIGVIGAQSLLCPIENLLNLSTLFLDLRQNQICDIGTYSLFYPLSNLISLQSLELHYYSNITDKQTGHLFNGYFNKLKYLVLED